MGSFGEIASSSITHVYFVSLFHLSWCKTNHKRCKTAKNSHKKVTLDWEGSLTVRNWGLRKGTFVLLIEITRSLWISKLKHLIFFGKKNAMMRR